jgi:hypothetical protein
MFGPVRKKDIRQLIDRRTRLSLVQKSVASHAARILIACGCVMNQAPAATQQPVG